MVLGISSAAALAGLQFGGKALSALGGFMDNSDQMAKYNQDVQRVAAIDAQNQRTRANDLKIFAKYNNQKAVVDEKLFNIDQQAISQRNRARIAVSRATDDTVIANRDAFVRSVQRMRGGGAGRVNLDSSLLAARGRSIAGNLAKVSRLEDDRISSGYGIDFRAQNQRNMAADIGFAPTASQYITKFTPQDYSRNLLADSLKLGTGLMDAGLEAYKTYKSLSPEAIYEEVDGDQ